MENQYIYIYIYIYIFLYIYKKTVYIIKINRFVFCKSVRTKCHQKSWSLRTVTLVSKMNLTEKL